MIEIERLLEQKTFCVYPWVEQTVNANGKLSYCCVARDGGCGVRKEDGSFFRAGESSLGEFWNSKSLRAIRGAMLKGETVRDCSPCYFQESIGKESNRQRNNREWLVRDKTELLRRVEESLSDGHIRGAPQYLDLRLGNTCNLKCRSCNPWNSSRVQKENAELMAESAGFREFWAGEHGPAPVVRADKWWESEVFWQEVETMIPDLRKVYLTGGEPTLIERNYAFLEKCVEQGYANRIFLFFNTNATHISERFLSLIRHFEFVLINCSVDAFGAENDYIRGGSRWEKIAENLRLLRRAEGNLQLGITPVFQIYNALSITSLLDFLEAEGAMQVDFLHAIEPSYLDPRFLPRTIRDLAANRLRSFRDRSAWAAREPFLRNSLESTIRMLEQAEMPESPARLQSFLQYTKLLDEKRGEDFPERFPELAQMLAAEGFRYA